MNSNSSYTHMTSLLVKFGCVVMALLVVFGFAGRTVAAQTEAPANLDIIVVIDNSGSMHGTGGSDPAGLRYEATKMLIDLVTANDRIGVVHFSGDKTPSQAAPGHRILNEKNVNEPYMFRMDNDNRDTLWAKLDAVSVDYTVANDGKKMIKDWRINDDQVPPSGTKYRLAFTDVENLLSKTKTANKQVVIFLTDGAPDDMGKSTEVTTNIKTELDKLRVPVFLLLLQNQSGKSDAEIEAVKTGFTSANQPIITINSANDIAKAFARVITEAQPNTYLDELKATADSGTNSTTAFSTGVTKDQSLSDVTFVFASTDNKVKLKSPEVTGAPSGASLTNGKSTRFQIYHYTNTGAFADGSKWGFTVNVKPTDVANFVFMRSSLRIQLKYPDTQASYGQSLVYPKDTNPILVAGTVSGINEKSYADVKVSQSTVSCDDTKSPDIATYSSGLHSAGEAVFWKDLPKASQPIYVSLLLHPENALAMRRCVELLPSDSAFPLTITEPGIDNPKPDEKGNIGVSVTMPSSSGLTLVPPILFNQVGLVTDTQRLNNQTTEVMLNSDGKGDLALQSGGKQKIRIVVPGFYNGHPIVLYTERMINPELSCVFKLANPPLEPGTPKPSTPDQEVDLRTLDLGVITTTQTLQNDIICKSQINSGTPPVIKPDTNMRREGDAEPIALPADLLNVGAPQQSNDGSNSWPLKLSNISGLKPGIYHITMTATSGQNSQTIDVKFTRPPSAIELENVADGVQIDGVVDETNGTLSSGQCVKYHGVLADNVDIQSDLVVSEIINGSQTVATSTITAQLLDDDACAGGKRLHLKVTQTLPVGKYTVKLLGKSSDSTVIVTPDLRVTFEKVDPQVIIYFPERLLAKDADGNVIPGTYVLEKRIWSLALPFMADTFIPYTATVTHANGMPVIADPITDKATNVFNSSDTGYQDKYQFLWGKTHPDIRYVGGYEGRLTPSVPFWRWPGSEYDVQLRIDDPKVVSPRGVVMRVQTYSWWWVLGVLVALFILYRLIRWLYTRFTQAYSGAVRFSTDDIDSPWIDLRRYGKAPVLIVRLAGGGIDTLQAVRYDQEKSSDDVVAKITPTNREQIRVDVKSLELNPDVRKAREILLGKSVTFGEEGVRIAYRMRK